MVLGMEELSQVCIASLTGYQSSLKDLFSTNTVLFESLRKTEACQTVTEEPV